MASLSEISVLRVPDPEGHVQPGEPSVRPSLGTWVPVELPRGRRPSPTTLVILALLAGIGALVLGALAVWSARTASTDVVKVAPRPASSSLPAVERQVLSLLAKPSTDRVMFRGSGGRLVLAVGSGGRAAILIRGFGRATPETPYYAWVVRSGKATRAARIVGSRRAVVLTVPVGRRERVVVAPERPAAKSLERASIVAVRE